MDPRWQMEFAAPDRKRDAAHGRHFDAPGAVDLGKIFGGDDGGLLVLAAPTDCNACRWISFGFNPMRGG